MVEPLRGEVQQWAAGRWRTVLTAGGLPVTDRRRPEPGDRPARRLLFGFDGAADGDTVIVASAGDDNLLSVLDQRFFERRTS